jgi:hypothetical protein
MVVLEKIFRFTSGVKLRGVRINESADFTAPPRTGGLVKK